MKIIIFIIFLCCSYFQASEIISPDELFERMSQNAQLKADSGSGIYYSYTYNKPFSDDEINSEINRVINDMQLQAESLDGAKKQEILDQIPNKRLELEKNLKKSSYVSIDEYYLSGNKTRTNRWLLNDDALPDDARKMIGQLDLNKANTIQVWDGQKLSRVIPNTSEVNKRGTPNADYLFLNSNPPSSLKIFEYGREVDKKVLSTFRDAGLKAETKKTVWKNDEDAILLSFGDKDNGGYTIEVIVLPNKGYVMAGATHRLYGYTIAMEEYDKFIKTNDGFWMPTKIKLEHYEMSKEGKRVLKTRNIMEALESLKVNIIVNDKLFDIVDKDNSYIVNDETSGKSISYMIHGTNSPRYEELFPIENINNDVIEAENNIDSTPSKDVYVDSISVDKKETLNLKNNNNIDEPHTASNSNKIYLAGAFVLLFTGIIIYVLRR